jgi:hypothetical protein
MPCKAVTGCRRCLRSETTWRTRVPRAPPLSNIVSISVLAHSRGASILGDFEWAAYVLGLLWSARVAFLSRRP